MNLISVIILLILGVVLISYASKKATPQRKSRVTRSKQTVRKQPSEKKAINEKTVKDLTKTEIKDRQVYAAIRAYTELMIVDGKTHSNELLIVPKICSDEERKLSKEFSQHSDEYKFVWAKEDNLYEALKTYNKAQVISFFDNLFSIAVVDGEITDSEINFLNSIYSKIRESDLQSSAKRVVAMFKNWKVKNGI